MMNDVERMLFCDVCGNDACFGFGVTLDGLKMGDVGTWRCAEHHPVRKANYTCGDPDQARAASTLYPTAPLHEAAE